MKPLPLALVVETTYRARCRWKPEVGTTGGGILALMSHAVPIQRRPGWTMNILTRAVQQSGHLKGTRGDADQTAERILKQFADW